jgi:hypothetical protein
MNQSPIPLHKILPLHPTSTPFAPMKLPPSYGSGQTYLFLVNLEYADSSFSATNSCAGFDSFLII